MSLKTKYISDALHKLFKGNTKELHKPFFAGNEKKYLEDCIDSSYVSYVGKYVQEFEQSLCEFTGCKRAIVFSNGTSALQIALIAAGIKANNEVLLPSLTFVATANAISHAGAIPHFIDSREYDLGIDPDALESWLKHSTTKKNGECINKKTNRVIKAVVPMHTFGHPSSMEEIVKISNDHNLLVIEDAAEAIGSFYKGVHVGNFGIAGVLSFNGNKTITTGGGGAIITNDLLLADTARHISTTAKIPHQWEFIHDQVGYNLRMPNINAAVGCAQLEQIKSILENKRLLFDKYENAFKDIEGIKVIKEPSNCSSNYWLQGIIIDKNFAYLRDEILEETNKAGISSRPIWRPLHLLKPYLNCPAAPLSQANDLYSRIINLPSGVDVL